MSFLTPYEGRRLQGLLNDVENIAGQLAKEYAALHGWSEMAMGPFGGIEDDELIFDKWYNGDTYPTTRRVPLDYLWRDDWKDVEQAKIAATEAAEARKRAQEAAIEAQARRREYERLRKEFE